jgi:predicted GNAT family N-acyltransferase
VAKKLPRYPIVPATLMGRLAVDHRARGRRLGELMLMDAWGRALRSETATYAFVVDAKDEAAEGFYKAYRFLPLAVPGRRFFIPMAEIAKLFA